MKNGDVVFFKAAKSGSRVKEFARFNGYGFGVLLGHVPPFQKDPPKEHLLRIIGSIGLITIDDIGEFLGEKSSLEVQEKFKRKYYGIEPAPPAKAEPEEAAQS